MVAKPAATWGALRRTVLETVEAVVTIPPPSARWPAGHLATFPPSAWLPSGNENEASAIVASELAEHSANTLKFCAAPVLATLAVHARATSPVFGTVSPWPNGPLSATWLSTVSAEFGVPTPPPTTRVPGGHVEA